jgi:hypothetical protein
MTDIPIHDVPDEVIAGVDVRAVRLGLSRTEYVRRRLAQDASTAGTAVSSRTWLSSLGNLATWPIPRRCHGPGDDLIAGITGITGEPMERLRLS